MCYTNASPVQIAQSISDFSTNEEGYKLFKSNCLHFVLLLLRRFCGDEQVRQARRQLFNLIMSVGGWFQSLSMGKKGGRSHHLPVMYVPPESTPENDLRRELTSFDEILECISTDCHAKRQTLAGIGENIVVNDEFNSL
jgi:hypothetical protein